MATDYWLMTQRVQQFLDEVETSELAHDIVPRKQPLRHILSVALRGIADRLETASPASAVRLEYPKAAANRNSAPVSQAGS